MAQICLSTPLGGTDFAARSTSAVSRTASSRAVGVAYAAKGFVLSSEGPVCRHLRYRAVSGIKERRATRARAASDAAAESESPAAAETSGDAASTSSETAPPSNSSKETLLDGFRKVLENPSEEEVATFEEKLQASDRDRDHLAQQVTSLTEEVAVAKDRFLRLNADFDNFRKRAEREKTMLATSSKGDVIEELLPMIDNFERARAAIKASTDGEAKIDSSYQGIYKQFVEIMKGFGVTAVETVGKEFDPQVHEAIMREDSEEFVEGVVTLEFRKGFTLGEKLLRPAMVKVSSGPGPAGSASSPSPEPQAVRVGVSGEGSGEQEQGE